MPALLSGVLAAALTLSMPVCSSAVCGDACGNEVSAAAVATESETGNGNVLYQPLKITGTGMPEEQVFSVRELLTIKNESGLGLDARCRIRSLGKDAGGLDLKPFLEMCGADLSEGTVLTFYTGSSAGGGLSPSGVTLSAAELTGENNRAVLILPEDPGQAEVSPDSLTVAASGSRDVFLENVGMIMVGAAGNMENPYYGMHATGLGGKLSYMESTVLTVNFFAGEESGAPFKTCSFTIGEIEKMMREHPEKVCGNYFGMSGNEASKVKMGLGGFFDYYEGISMEYLLAEKCGLRNTPGIAVFYDRDGKESGRVTDLGYFFGGDRYLEITDDKSVSGVVPIIGVSKNGAPLLPRHDHEMEGNVNFNTFNTNAAAAGFDTKIGLVKNVSGPMIAGLPNMDGAYGGYRQETAGSCIRIDLIVDRDDYPELLSGDSTRSADSTRNYLKKCFLPISGGGFGLVEYLRLARILI